MMVFPRGVSVCVTKVWLVGVVVSVGNSGVEVGIRVEVGCDETHPAINSKDSSRPIISWYSLG